MIIRNVQIFNPEIKGYEIANNSDSLIEILRGSPVVETINGNDVVIGFVADNDSLKYIDNIFVGDIVIHNDYKLKDNEKFKQKQEVCGNVVMENGKFGFRVDSIIIHVERVNK